MPSFVIKPVSDLNELQEATVQEGEGFLPKKIVIIPVEGLIINARTPTLLQPSENQVSVIMQQLQKAADDPRVAAIVLRINSPGGTVTAGDTLYQLIGDFKAKTGKPVIASAQEMAASGGFYVAMAADEVVARPTSVVGSIGVIFTSFDIEGTLGKIGARTYTIKTGRYKDMGSPFKAMTPEEHDLMQNMIEQYFARFQQVVQSQRKMSADELGKVNDGRVFTGEDALRLRLVDRLGSLEDALDLARQRAGAKGAKAVLYIRPYGYGGSIYAANQLPPPELKSTQVVLPLAEETLPAGFYYLWRPGSF